MSKQSGALTLTRDAHIHYIKSLSNASSQSVRGRSAGFTEGAKQVRHWNVCQGGKKLNTGAAACSKLPGAATIYNNTVADNVERGLSSPRESNFRVTVRDAWRRPIARERAQEGRKGRTGKVRSIMM